jgi:hypothetical protein
MNPRNTCRKLGRCAFALALAAAIAVPAAQARHVPGEVAVGATARGVSQPLRIVTVNQPRGFDFGAASIGAAGAIGTVLIASGSVVLIKRNRSRTPAKPFSTTTTSA